MGRLLTMLGILIVIPAFAGALAGALGLALN
jgi:hypothetical protein